MASYVLVHGAWHGAWCWFKVIPLLQRQGHKVFAPDLPSHGVDKRATETATLQGYVDRVCQAIDACEEPPILVGHSMGGVVISQAAESRPDRVAKLVYLTAFLLQDGKTLLDVAQTDAQALVLPNLVFAADKSSARVKDEAIRNVFYGDCSDSDVALARTLLVPQAAAPFATPVHTTAQNWGRIPRVYIECLDDRAISIAAQRAMHGQLPCEKVHTLQTSHSPFFSAPERLVEHLAGS